MSPTIPVMKFGGKAMHGRKRFGADEARILEEIARLQNLNEIYGMLVEHRNLARAHRLREIARQFIIPLCAQGQTPVVVVSAFDWATDKLAQFAAAIAPEPDPREYARLLMTGELRANAALALALVAEGQPARSLTGREAGIVTKPQPKDALVERVETDYLRELLERGIVPVVAGFQGYYRDPATQKDEVSILGRGGSNLTAVALAAALGQTECTMFTDVDGLYTQPPPESPDAQKLDEIAVDDLLQWDPFPQVIQKDAALYAREKGVNIWIRSAFEPNIPGSLIRCRP